MVRHDCGVTERCDMLECGFYGRNSPWLASGGPRSLWPLVFVVADLSSGMVGILHMSIAGCCWAGHLVEDDALLQDSNIAGLGLRLYSIAALRLRMRYEAAR